MKHFAQSYLRKVRMPLDRKATLKIKNATQFAKIIVDFNTLLSCSVVDNGKQEIPRLGKIIVHKKIPSMINKDHFKHAGYAIDFNLSRKEKKVVYHLNAHSDGCMMKTAWTPALTLIGDTKVGWFFKAGRNLTRKRLASKIKSGFTDYPILKLN